MIFFLLFLRFLANPEAARLYTENKKEYERRVKETVEESWKS